MCHASNGIERTNIPPSSHTCSVRYELYLLDIMDEQCTTYTTAAGVWRRGGVVEIVSSFGTPIACFPIDFLASSGDNTWAYVYFAIGLLIRVKERYPGRISDPEGLAVLPDLSRRAGIYTYTEEGNWNRFTSVHRS